MPWISWEKVDNMVSKHAFVRKKFACAKQLSRYLLLKVDRTSIAWILMNNISPCKQSCSFTAYNIQRNTVRFPCNSESLSIQPKCFQARERWVAVKQPTNLVRSVCCAENSNGISNSFNPDTSASTRLHLCSGYNFGTWPLGHLAKGWGSGVVRGLSI